MNGVLVSLAFVLGTTSAFAGDSGHGGGGWECADSNGKKTTVLLDLWEAANTDSIIDGGLPMPTKFDVNLAIRRAVDVYGEYGNIIAGEYNMLRRPYDPVTKTGFWRALKPGVSIAFPSDAYPQFQKTGCTPVGIALMDDDRHTLWVDPIVLGEMSTEQQDALFFHEALYLIRRSADRDNDSRISRKMVGYLYSSLSESVLPIRDFSRSDFKFYVDNDVFDSFCHLQLGLEKVSQDDGESFLTISYGPRNDCHNHLTDALNAFIGVFKISPSNGTSIGSNLILDVTPNSIGFFMPYGGFTPLSFILDKDLRVTAATDTTATGESLNFTSNQNH